MKVAVIGRTAQLITAARLIVQRGHTVPVVWTCRAEPDYDTRPEDFAELATELQAEFVFEVGISKPESIGRLRDFGCDIAISVNWLTLMTQEVLNIFPFGVLNAHAGDLPRYKGNACPNWAILNEEPHVGLCIIQMTPELDAGPVVLRERFALTSDTYIGEVCDWLVDRTPVMLADAVESLANGTAVPEPQPDDPARALRTFPRRPGDGLIDWSWPSERVLRLIRAVSRPYQGAFTTLEGDRKVTVWHALQVTPLGAFLAVPGQVCYREDNDPVIACGSGMIRLTDVGIDGIDGAEGAKAEIHKSLRNRLV